MRRARAGAECECGGGGAVAKSSELSLFKSRGLGEDDHIEVKGLWETLKCAVIHYHAAIQRVRMIGVYAVEEEEKEADEVGVVRGREKYEHQDEHSRRRRFVFFCVAY